MRADAMARRDEKTFTAMSQLCDEAAGGTRMEWDGKIPNFRFQIRNALRI
jgi:hypothetical protein